MTPKPTQLEKIKADLIAGMKVNAVYAFDRYGITRLAAIIHRLKRQGWPIRSGQVKNNGLAVYTVPEEWRMERQISQAGTQKKAG